MAFIKPYHGVSVDLITYYNLKAVSVNLKKNQYQVEEQSEGHGTHYMPIIRSLVRLRLENQGLRPD